MGGRAGRGKVALRGTTGANPVELQDLSDWTTLGRELAARDPLAFLALLRVVRGEIRELRLEAEPRVRALASRDRQRGARHGRR